MVESSLHISLWGEALKIAIYLLNRVPTKATITTPYELWIGRKPSLKHLHIWGCPAQRNTARDTDFQKEYDDSLSTKGNPILSCVQGDISRPSSSYSQIAYPQEEAPLKESIIQEET